MICNVVQHRFNTSQISCTDLEYHPTQSQVRKACEAGDHGDLERDLGRGLKWNWSNGRNGRNGRCIVAICCYPNREKKCITTTNHTNMVNLVKVWILLQGARQALQLSSCDFALWASEGPGLDEGLCRWLKLEGELRISSYKIKTQSKQMARA